MQGEQHPFVAHPFVPLQGGQILRQSFSTSQKDVLPVRQAKLVASFRVKVPDGRVQSQVGWAKCRLINFKMGMNSHGILPTV